MAKLYIQAPNIVASQYAQQKLKDVFGFQILRGDGSPHFSDRFVVVAPPDDRKDDKPVICYYKPTMDQDGNLDYDKTHEWIPLLDALQLIKLVHTPLTH